MRGRHALVAAAMAALLASAPTAAAARQQNENESEAGADQRDRGGEATRADDDRRRPDSADTGDRAASGKQSRRNTESKKAKVGKRSKRTADLKISNLVVEVPFEPDATAPDEVGRKRLDAAATWVKKKPRRRLILLSRPDNDEQPPEIAAERANLSIEYLRERGVTDEQLDNASSSLLTRFEPSTEREVRYVTLLQRRFDDATRAERKKKRRERRELRRQQEQGDGDWTDRDYALFVGAGALGYLFSDTRDAIPPGTSWDITLLARANQRLATEVTYVGAAAPLDRAMSPTLVSTLVEGAFRLQTRRYAGIWRAYGLAGVGFGLVIANDDTPGEEAYETVAHLPVGGGLEFAYDMVRLDLRAIARLTALDDFRVVPASESKNGLDLDNFQVSARLGWQF